MLDQEGYLVYNHKMVLKEKLEKTIVQNFVKNNDKFGFVTSGNMPSMDALKWQRFKTLTHTGNNAVYFRESRWEAVQFKPR